MKIKEVYIPAACVGLFALEVLLAHPVLASDYYVSATGEDKRDGTSPERAWLTIARANRQSLRPGDRLLFQGGDAFEGNLVVTADGIPSAASPITVGSFGRGKATIRAGDGTGIASENSGGLVIRDLIVEGKERRTNRNSGVSVLNTLSGAKRLEFIRIENVEARGFGKYGIAVGAWPGDHSQSGFRDVRISGCLAFDNVHAGIHVFGFHDYYAKTYAHHDVAVIDCIARDNPGDPDYMDQHSGNGILLHDVDGGLIDGCTAFGNGGLSRSKSGGPVGIWAWSSRKLVIQNCVSVRNRTGGKYDGGGFDFDGGVSESILQYNYSAENDGPGFMVFDFGAAPFRLAGNAVRFNISENDGRKNGYSGIHVNSVGDPIERLSIYHNTIFAGPSEKQDRPQAVFIHKTKDCGFYNNLIITAGGCALLDVGGHGDGLHIQGNHYWTAAGEFLVRQAGKSFGSLTEWRSQSGFERLEGKDVGAAGDPLLNAFGRGDIVICAGKRFFLDRYKLRAKSPLIKSGLDLRRLFHIDVGARDFWGNPLPKDTAAVGAHAG
jgi:hypothetical protein